MPRGGRRPNSGRRKGSKNKRLRRMLAIDGVHVSELARQHTEEAVRELVEVMRTSKSEPARISAATALLDRGWGKPTVQVDVSARSRVDLVYRSEAEFRQALIDRGLPPRLLPPTLVPDEVTEGEDSEGNDDDHAPRVPDRGR
jgi:hypothetical protein